MMKQKIYMVTCLVLFLLYTGKANAQNADRISIIQQTLEKLSAKVPGLNEPVQLSITNVSVRSFLAALAKSNNLNLSVDPKLNMRVFNNFTNVSALNILVYLAKEDDLDISVTGTIINISRYNDPDYGFDEAKDIRINYNATGNTLSLELEGDSLVLVARKITQLSGKNIIVPNSLLQKKVSAFIKDAPFDAALKKLAFANNVKVASTKDGFYLFQPLDESEELYVDGDQNTATRKVFKPQGPAAGHLNFFSKTLPDGQRVLSVDVINQPVIDIVKSAAAELGKNYFLYSDIKGTITAHATDISFDDLLSFLFHGTDYTWRLQNGIYMMGDRKLEGLRTSRVVVLQNRSLDTIQSMIPLDWKKGVEIKEFKEQNTLLLSGATAQIDEIDNFIKQLDKQVPMIMIEVTLIDVNKTRTIATGLTAGSSDSTKTGGTVLSGLDYTIGSQSVNNLLNKLGGSLNLGHVSPNFYVTLKALETNQNVEVHSVPKLTTLNGHTASLSIGTTRYYEVQTQNVIPSLASPTSIYTQQFNKVDANMVINIKPEVAGDNQVTLGINIDISDFIGTPPTNAPPPTSTSKFETMMRVNNEDMIVLGGLERTEDDNSSSGIPLLSRIPVLKWIFSSRTKTHANVVTLVFIKPTIIH